ncbi:MAG: hypothetical protein LUH22_01225 [Bacteroides sp.]|nr:hypothetical protein [Bacteroides sp.]
MRSNINFYSTNTYLAYTVSQIYYNKKHFVWCSPVFDAMSLDKLHHWRNNPPSSSPFNIYTELKEAVTRKDLHNSKIEANKIGIMKGAQIALKKEIIDEVEYN